MKIGTASFVDLFFNVISNMAIREMPLPVIPKQGRRQLPSSPKIRPKIETFTFKKMIWLVKNRTICNVVIGIEHVSKNNHKESPFLWCPPKRTRLYPPDD
jgi:hypothetical protein